MDDDDVLQDKEILYSTFREKEKHDKTKAHP